MWSNVQRQQAPSTTPFVWSIVVGAFAWLPLRMNAIYDAVGVRITDLPATPEKVLMAIRDKERRDATQAAE